MENKNNTGAFFVNDKKQTEKQPDFKGVCVIDGVEKEIGVWVKTSKAGKEYYYIAFSEPFKKSEKSNHDDLPFG